MGEEGESRPLRRPAISHLLLAVYTGTHTAVATGLSPQPSVSEGLTHCQITRYRGQQGQRNRHEHWHTCTREFCSSDCQMPNSRVRGG